jgi:signal transduction histidine kinase
MSGSLGTPSLPGLCPAPEHTPFSRSVPGLWEDPVLRSAFLAVGLLLAYQLVVTLLQPVWIGTVTDWLRALLAWPTLLGVVLLSFWLTHTGRWVARPWWLVSAALLFYAVGRTQWAVENQFITPNHVPFPSLPDLFFLLQYPFFLLALLLVPPVHPKMQRARVALDACLLLGSAFLLSGYFLLDPIYQGSHETLLGKLVNLTYPVGDLAIFVGLVALWLHYEEHELPLAVVALVMAALVCLFIADTWAAALLLETSSYRSGSPPDLFRMAFYLLISLAGLVRFRFTQRTLAEVTAMPMSERPATPRREDLLTSLRVLSPAAVALLTGSVVIIWPYLGTRLLHPMVPSLAALALLGLALVRQGLAVMDNERSSREREEALRNSAAQMETFLGVAGHELKNPVASAKLSLQLAERRLHQMSQRAPESAPDLEPVLETIARAERQEHRLDRLVDELLDASRIQTGKLEIHLEPTDLVVIVREIVEEQSQANPQRTLRLECPSDLRAPILADADHIGGVVTNYLTNALKYSPTDCPVEVGVEVETLQAHVWVHDHGPGLPPEEQERIWERFHRAEGIEVQSGTGVGLGLGLHISRIIIEQHHGQVGVRSAPGQGSTFWFSLPLADVTHH